MILNCQKPLIESGTDTPHGRGLKPTPKFLKIYTLPLKKFAIKPPKKYKSSPDIIYNCYTKPSLSYLFVLITKYV